jgi:hypothetical protein
MCQEAEIFCGKRKAVWCRDTPPLIKVGWRCSGEADAALVGHSRLESPRDKYSGRRVESNCGTAAPICQGREDSRRPISPVTTKTTILVTCQACNIIR